MAEMALYARADGLFEPRAEKAIEFVKSQAGRMIVADIAHDTRTSLQNRFLNGWVYTKQIVRKLTEAGITMPGGIPWTRDTLHAAFQACFLVKMEFVVNGETVKVYESTADMSRKRFCEYIDEQIKPFARDMWGIEIEDPRKGYWLELMREMRK